MLLFILLRTAGVLILIGQQRGVIDVGGTNNLPATSPQRALQFGRHQRAASSHVILTVPGKQRSEVKRGDSYLQMTSVRDSRPPVTPAALRQFSTRGISFGQDGMFTAYLPWGPGSMPGSERGCGCVSVRVRLKRICLSHSRGSGTQLQLYTPIHQCN